jgi:HSP20 family molecular chaperone IbpA
MNMANETELQVQDTQKQEIDETEAERTRDRKAFVPRADIYEDGDNIFIVADLPGVDENLLEITLEKSVLTITGNVEPKVPEGYTLAYAEYEIGDYQRSFRLSNQVDLDKIEATIKDGVLRLLLPKVGPAKTKKIAVKAS